MSVLVCFALPFESAPFRKRQPENCTLLHHGMGSTAGLEKILQRTAPSLVISAGLCGALHPSLSVGDTLYDSTDCMALDFSRRWKAARFTTADRLIDTRPEKKQLRKTTNADAVDMESGLLGPICRTAGIPFLIFRTVSDDADTDLAVPGSILAQSGIRRVGSLACYLAGYPGRITAFKHMLQAAGQARRTLSDDLRDLLARNSDCLHSGNPPE